MKTKTTFTHWSDLTLYQLDNSEIYIDDEHDGEYFRDRLREYRDNRCIDGWILVDPSDYIPGYEDGDDPPVWDHYNNEFREAWDAGPTPDQIDWTGLD